MGGTRRRTLMIPCGLCGYFKGKGERVLRHRDNFSSKQRQRHLAGRVVFCLLHTAGAQANYIDRLEEQAREQLGSGEEAEEESRGQRRSREKVEEDAAALDPRGRGHSGGRIFNPFVNGVDSELRRSPGTRTPGSGATQASALSSINV